ncbi:MAG: agmatine deiminase family protein [Verrucomicrobiota bacterium]
MHRRRFVKWGVLSGASLPALQTLHAKAPDYTKTGAKLIGGRTPLADGFRMPGEWERHQGTIMVFVPAQNWKGYGLEDARKEWASVANTVSQFEPVTMVVNPPDKAIAGKMLSSKIKKLYLPVNDGWARDSGPMFLKGPNQERRVAGFTFNGWGAKFPPYDDDALLKARLAAHFRSEMYVSPVVVEGGGVLQDGEGTVITTEECLLHRNRNPRMKKADVEQALKDYLGAKKVIWIAKGLTPDPITNGHVDGIAAFVKPGVVLLHRTDRRLDPNYKRLKDAKERLLETKDAKGRSLKVIDVPLADHVAHMNFYICNGAVIVPTENNPKADEPALEVLRESFPNRQVIGVSGVILSKGGGGVHCITQQIPA